MLTKVIYIAILIILTSVIATADSNYIVGDNVTIWADIYNGSTYAASNAANITILYPNFTQYKYVMQYQSDGLFYINTTIPISGQYYYSVKYYATNVLLATASNSFVAVPSVEDGVELSMTSLAYIFALIFTIVFFMWIGMHNQRKEWPFNIIGMVMELVAFSLVIIVAFMVMKLAEGTDYYGVGYALFSVVITAVTLVAGVLWVVVVVFIVNIVRDWLTRRRG